MKLFKDTDIKKITFKLADKRSNAFVRATIEDINGAVPAQQVNLPHISSGKYSVAVTLGVGSYDVTYEVFKDAAFTKSFSFYEDGYEFVRVEDIQQTVNNKVDEAINQVDDLDAQIAN